MIPEHVQLFTSISSRVPRTFDNHFGVFRYQNIKQSAFFGYQSVDIQGTQILLADPEKALLDLWHLEKGEWSVPRMIEMRFQGFEMVIPEKLKQYTLQFNSPRLYNAIEIWLELKKIQHDEAVDL